MNHDPDRNPLDPASETEPPTSMDFSSDDAFSVGPGTGSSRRIDRNGVVLVVILLIAVGGLWSMRTLRNGSAEMSFSQSLPDRLKVEPVDGDVMKRLMIPDASGLELHSHRDPFQTWRPAAMSDEGALIEEMVTTTAPDREMLCADWKDEVDRIAGILKLKSVLGGGTERALVNIEGVLLATGDTFDIAKTDIEFSVVSTARRSVMLGCYNAEIDCWHEARVAMGAGE